MLLKQLSVFLENKPGALSAPCRLLADASINIDTFSLADARQFGILRLITKDWQRARDLLEQNGYAATLTDVIAIEMPDKPGALAHILSTLEAANLNVEYTYALTEKRGPNGIVIFRLTDPVAALPILDAAQIKILPPSYLFPN